MNRVNQMTKKAIEKGLAKPSKNEVNEILRSPARPRKRITTWAHSDSPRNQWLRKMDMLESDGEEDIIDEPEEWSDVDSTYSVGSSVHPFGEQRDIEIDECLFCGLRSGSFKANLAHMQAAHDFRLPDQEYLISPEEFFLYLADKVGQGNMCLVCNYKGKAFYSLQAVRDHMLKKGHCYVNVQGENALEYANFYDFSKSNDEPELLREELLQEHLRENERENDGFELVLPSGAVLGHRTLHRFFRQRNISNQIVPKPRTNLRPHYAAISYGDEKSITNDLRKVWKFKERFDMKNGVRNNKVRMKYFKDRNDGLQ